LPELGEVPRPDALHHAVAITIFPVVPIA
jgi:hypothetical protein